MMIAARALVVATLHLLMDGAFLLTSEISSEFFYGKNSSEFSSSEVSLKNLKFIIFFFLENLKCPPFATRIFFFWVRT